MQGHLNSIIKYQHYSSIRRDLELLKKSDLFDLKYYTAYVPRVEKMGIDPYLHYLVHGGFIGRDPSPNFDSSWYLQSYPEIDETGINPLIHYLRQGKTEDKAPYSKQNGPLIEFVGIPGSGKSTLYTQINRMLGETLGYRPGPRDLWTRMADEVRFKAVRGGAYQSLERFILENEIFISALLYDQAKHNKNTTTNATDINSLLPYFFSLCAYYQTVSEDHTKKWCLFDEGFFYYLFPYFNKAGNSQSQAIIETMPKIDLLIHLDTGVSLCIERMKARDQGIPIPYRKLSEYDLLRTLTQLDEDIQSSLDVVENNPIQILHIDGKTPMDKSILSILTTLGARLAECP
ncbi:hypothetical protein KQH62_03285 [bacterium]|nr:hypothetical protein [bacterium]